VIYLACSSNIFFISFLAFQRPSSRCEHICWFRLTIIRTLSFLSPSRRIPVRKRQALVSAQLKPVDVITVTTCRATCTARFRVGATHQHESWARGTNCWDAPTDQLHGPWLVEVTVQFVNNYKNLNIYVCVYTHIKQNKYNWAKLKWYLTLSTAMNLDRRNSFPKLSLRTWISFHVPRTVLEIVSWSRSGDMTSWTVAM